MNRSDEAWKKALEYVLPWVVLVILLAYTYAHFFKLPYGFTWHTPEGTIQRIFVNEREPTLHTGDQLLRVGSVDWVAFQADPGKELIKDMAPGDRLPITVRRGDDVITVQWTLPGTTPGELRDELTSEWFIAYFFWIAGTLTVLLLRPRDDRWLLLTAFNYVNAIWILTGSSLAYSHTWYSALVLRSAIWISLPIYLHLHWVFPRPLGRLSILLVRSLYGTGLLLALAQWLNLLPTKLYILAFLAAVVGSMALLIIHFVRQPDMQRELGFLIVAAMLAIGPSAVMSMFAEIQGHTPHLAELALLSFPMLPFAYLYAAYRRQLGGLEMRVNRLISIFAFLILGGAVIVPLLALSTRLPVFSPDQALIISVIASVVATALSLGVYPLFQTLVERRWLGIATPSKEFQQEYSDDITSSSSFAGLTRLINNKIMPSLLVRQFAFILLEDGSTQVLLRMGVTEEQIPARSTRERLMPLTGKYRSVQSSEDSKLTWIRLVLPLKMQDEVLGFWLFGRRDPDDVYSSVEIPILQSFANQAAVALSNIQQSERLRAMYQADISRHEKERLRLARELHDSVLSELAGMLMNADMQALPKSFQAGYQKLTQQLREIVSELRPPMLSYGLKPAIEELADNLMERGKDTMEFKIELEAAGDRYPLETEQHLFRIVQEASENALRHSCAARVVISGQLKPDRVELRIADNGSGFELGKENADLYDLLSDRHFGLAGMFERAELIDAEIHITSGPDAGTRIDVSWRSPTTSDKPDLQGRFANAPEPEKPSKL
jgi:signal transduction histidine kinase